MHVFSTLRARIYALALVGAVIMGMLMAFTRVSDIRTEAVESVVGQSRTITRQAEIARDMMSQRLQDGLIRPFEELPADKIMKAVPVITAIEIASKDAQGAGYTFRVPKIRPRNLDNRPDTVERAVLEEFKNGTAEEKVIISDTDVRYFRPIRLTQECLYCHGGPKGSKDVTGGVKEGWQTGEVHGAFEIIFDLAPVNAHVQTAQFEAIGLSAGVLALVALCVYFVSRTSIMNPLRRIHNYASRVAAGELDCTLETCSAKELGEVCTSIETMVYNMKEKMEEARAKGEEAEAQRKQAEALLAENNQKKHVEQLMVRMREAATGVAQVSREVAEATSSLSHTVSQAGEGAQSQSQRTGETARAMEMMNAAILEVAMASSQASDNAQSARERAEDGAQVVERSVSAIGVVSQKADALKEEMNALGGHAESINSILNVISDIADQTNLLALNAAIEAARAGDAGRGFAVVADEVRKLAEKTVTATKEVADVISAIQSSVRASVENAGSTAQAVEEAVTLVSSSGQSLAEIVSLAQATADKVSTIAHAVDEHSASATQISQAVDDVSKVAQETVGGMTQAQHAVEELNHMVARLGELNEDMCRDQTC